MRPSRHRRPVRRTACRPLPTTAALLCALGLLGPGAGPAGAQPELFVVNNETAVVRVYPPFFGGDVPPSRSFASPGLGSPVGVAVDACADEVVVTNAGAPWSVLTFPRTAATVMAPLRAITGNGPAAGDLTKLNDPFSVAVDPGAGEIFVANLLGGSAGAPGVTVYDRLDSGNVAPKRSITAFASGPWALALDLLHGELVVADGPGTANAIRVFPKTWAPAGPPALLRSIQGPSTGLASPVGVAVDPIRGVIAAANRDTRTVTIYSRTAHNNALPLQTLVGFTNPIGLVFEPVTGDLFVADSSFLSPSPGTVNSIRVYRLTGSTYVLDRAIVGQHTGLAGPAYLALWSPPALAPTSLVAALLPLSRSVKVGDMATAFVTIINTGAIPACQVGIAPATFIPALFGYQTTDCVTNALIGNPGTGATIPPGGRACYVIVLAPTEPFGPIDLAFNFAGLNTAPVPPLVGINTLLVSGSATDVPDVIALVATASQDGIVRIPGPGGAAAFSVATSNVGVGDAITVSVDTGGASLPIAGLLICRTDLAIDPAGGCVGPAGSTVTLVIGPGATPTFAIFVTAGGAIAFDPANHRLFIRFQGSDGVVRGATGVAVTTE